MKNQKEVWKDVPSYEGLYQVSNLGDVKSLDRTILQKTRYNTLINVTYKGKILNQESLKGNYRRVALSKKGNVKRFTVHRLVCLTFLNNNSNKPCVNHIDGVTSNNALSNLEWCTYSENERHSYTFLGKTNSNRKLTNNDVLFIKENAIKGKRGRYTKSGNIKKIADKFNISIHVVHNVINNKYYV